MTPRDLFTFKFSICNSPHWHDMLQLQQTLTGYPAAGVQYLYLPNESLILYPSGDAVIILNARTLALVRVLAFWEAFPSTVHTRDAISCISVDSGMKLIVAAMKSRLAAWSLSGTQKDTWRIHSTLVFPERYDVTVLDNDAGLLAVGSERRLSVYTLVLEDDVPTWSMKWTVSTVTPIILNFAPSLMYIAAVSKEDNAIRLYSTTSGRQTQLIPHPRPILKLAWRRPQALNRDDLIMYTITSDATLRIFFPVIDAPDFLQLHASLDLYSSLPFSLTGQLGSTSSVFWLDRKTVETVINHILANPLLTDDARTRRIREIKEESWDLFMRILSDGSVVVTAVANLDRRPPTLLQHFTIQQSQPGVFSKPPAYLYVLSNPDPCLLTLITSPPLMSLDLSPLSFFEAKSGSLMINSTDVENIGERESEIVRFIRTPEGKGVGALRAKGGEVWIAKKRGTKLIRSAVWDTADFVVVLDYGRQFVTYTKDDGLLKLHSSPSCTLNIPGLESLFTVPTAGGGERVLGVSADFRIFQFKATEKDHLTLVGEHKLPLAYPPRFILPVDPMAWTWSRDSTAHDILLSISENGEIAFWVPEAQTENGWRCTGKVRTNRTGFRKVRCSSAKKTALIVDGPDGDELTIWDSTESEFASGLEYQGAYSKTILDLDWSSTPDMQSILAVGYAHRIDILCQQRMTYFDEGPGWALCRTIDISGLTPYPISDSIWLTNGSFLIAAGQQMYFFSEPLVSPGEKAPESLMEYVARQNGPLDDYHPQMLLQCLIWNKVGLVKEIITNLSRVFLGDDHDSIQGFPHIPVERFLEKEQSAHAVVSSHEYGFLFNGDAKSNDLDDVSFARPVVTRLIRLLESRPLPNLSLNEQAHLIVLIQTTLEIDEQRRALDANGLRYLISMRSFFIINDRTSSPEKAAVNGAITDGTVPGRSARRERLRYRDMIWAFHSESQELMLQASTAACGGKLTWSDARALGIPLWLTSIDSLKSQFEAIARNEYMSGDVRDPTVCSVFYFALGKYKLVHGLWRQAAWHSEQNAMLKFLANDFTIDRWRIAALKNAFALLSKQRFEYAAAFFLLGGSLKDAVNVCIKYLNDFQLAIALARIVEQSNEGSILIDILTNSVLPTAFALGNRWLGSWAFWMLHRRDLAVRILLTPLQDIATVFGIQVTDIGEPHYDDPSLALLFSQLRSKTLQAAKGSSEISAAAEFKFVLQMARVFCRMGCHVLALDLVRSWSFAKPSLLVPNVSPTPSRVFAFPALMRRSSILIDMDLTSTRKPSPEKNGDPRLLQPLQEESDLVARRAGIGKLINSAKRDVQVPEFDMNLFF